MIRTALRRLALIGALAAAPFAPAAAQQGGADEPPAKTRTRTPAKPSDGSDGPTRSKTRDRTGAKEPASTKDKAVVAEKQTSAAPGKRKGAVEEKTPAKQTAAGAKGAAKKGAAAPPGLQASPVGTFGQWSVFAAGSGKDRICYAISRPQQRAPKSVARDGAYLFVTVRKPKLDNEIALIMGFPLKTAEAKAASASKTGSVGKAADANQILVGNSKFALVGKDKNAWVRDQSDEPKLVREMGKTAKLTVKTTSAKAEDVTDEYSLNGFGDALKRTREECK